MYPDGYAVRMQFPAPASTEEWVEFGLAKLDPAGPSESPPSKPENDARPPKVSIVSASLDGVPLRYETVAGMKPEKDGLAFEEMTGKEWMTWLKLHTGNAGGGDVIVDYVVRDEGQISEKGKAKRSEDVSLSILLPTFLIPIGKLEVSIESLAGMLRFGSSRIYS
jgi:hypothetical protein